MHENRINKWLKKSYNGHINQEIIVFVIQQNNPPYNLGDLQKIPYHNSNDFNLTMLDQDSKYRHFKNSIVVTNGIEDRSLEAIKNILLKNVILVDNEQSIVKMIELLKSKTLDVQNEIKYTLVEKVDLEEVLNQDIQSLTDFIIQRDRYIQKINFHLKVIDEILIYRYLDIYEHRNILLANFAQALYKLTSLNFTENEKAVGGKLRKILGAGSKVISFRSLNIALPIELRKNLRVYDLDENAIETKLKLQIAKKLLSLNCKDLDIQKISKTVELPQKQIEKMYSKYVLS